MVSLPGPNQALTAADHAAMAWRGLWSLPVARLLPGDLADGRAVAAPSR